MRAKSPWRRRRSVGTADASGATGGLGDPRAGGALRSRATYDERNEQAPGVRAI